MRPFDYLAPTSIEQALALLAAPDKSCRPLAGGTDLLVQLRHDLLETERIVDVKRIPELSRISLDPVLGLTVGAAVTCAQLCEHPGVRAAYPGLLDAVSIIGGAAIQGRATLGGNLCNAAPSADSVPAMIVLQATCQIAGPLGLRTVPVEWFCASPGKTILGPGELLVSIHLPPPTPYAGASYLRFTPRREMDIAVAGAAAWIALQGGPGAQIIDARIALSAVAPTPLLATEASASLIGQEPTESAFAKAAQVAQDAATPITDVRGTAAQRHHLVGVLVRRALSHALARAQTPC